MLVFFFRKRLPLKDRRKEEKKQRNKRVKVAEAEKKVFREGKD